MFGNGLAGERRPWAQENHKDCIEAHAAHVEFWHCLPFHPILGAALSHIMIFDCFLSFALFLGSDR